jgi:hypothetical protein
MHRDVAAGEDRRVRAHCLAANWQVRDMVACCVVGSLIRDGPIIYASSLSNECKVAAPTLKAA